MVHMHTTLLYARDDKPVACKKILFIPEIHCWPKWLYIVCVRAHVRAWGGERESMCVHTYMCVCGSNNLPIL